jgi:DNA-binding response OmpR family regulator
MKQKIAIIEDEPAIAEMYRFKLERSGYEVRCARNGKQGLELVKSWQPILILLDLMMPEMGGEEMLEKVRAADWGSNIKVIVLTNISKDEAPSKLRLLGVDRYIVKAYFTPSQVVKLVSEVLTSRKTVK